MAYKSKYFNNGKKSSGGNSPAASQDKNYQSSYFRNKDYEDAEGASKVEYTPAKRPTSVKPSDSSSTQTSGSSLVRGDFTGKRETSTADGWDIAKNAVEVGIANAGSAIASGAAFLEGAITKPLGDLLGNDELYKSGLFYNISQQTQRENELAQEKQAQALAGKNKATQIAADIGAGAVAAIPNSIIALMSGGTSAVAQGLAGAPASGLASTIGGVASNMAKNPAYWSSIAQTLGPAYDEAKEKGANELQASATALLSSMLNAGVEVSGGIEVLPERLKRGDTNAVLQWVMSTPEEGLEEVIQRFISGGTEKVVYDHDKPIFSATDEEAIINPKEMGKEFLMGTAVAGILGGGQIATLSALDAAARRSAADAEVDAILRQIAKETATGRRHEAAGESLALPGSVDTTQQENAPEAVIKENKGASNKKVNNTDLGYGEHGSKAFAEILESSNQTEEEVRRSFQSAYESGLLDVDLKDMRFVNDVQEKAYLAGRQDYIQNMERDKIKTTVIHRNGKLDITGAPNDISAEEIRQADFFLQAMGVKGGFGKTKGNANISDSGVLTIAQDFGIDDDLLAQLGDMDHIEKVAKLAHTRDASLTFYLSHEVGVHRLMQLAPEEGRAFINAMYQHLSEGRPEIAGTLAEAKQSLYAEQGENLTTEKAVEEVVADSLIELYGSEQDFMAAVERVVNGNDQKAKQGARTFKEILDSIVEKLKAFVAKLTGKERTEAQNALTEVQQLQALYEKALKAATDKVKSAETKNATSEGGVQHNLKSGKRINEAGIRAALADVMDHGDAGDDNLVLLGDMPQYIQNISGINGDLYIFRNHAYENMVTEEQAEADGRIAKTEKERRNQHFHGLGEETMVQAVLALEEPIITIADQGTFGNPALSMVLPVFDEQNHPIHAVVGFYANEPVNGVYKKRPHVAVTFYGHPYEYEEGSGRKTITDVVNAAVADNKVLDFDNKKMRADLTVIAQDTTLGNVTAPSLTKNVAQFQKNVKSFKDKNKINYSLKTKKVTPEEAKANDKKALEHFGRTYKWAETGYVLLDGSKLDFSGKHEGGPGGYRTVDHRDISDALGEDYGGDDYSGSMVQFMSEGNIRIMPESGGINLSVKPTKAQLDALSDFVSKNRGEVYLDIDDQEGNTLSSTEYPRGTHANKVISDITKYFDSGETPRVSELAQFRYSLKGQKDLLKENARLKEVNEELRGQFKTTEFAKVDKKSLDSFTRKLLRDYTSGADMADVREALDGLYTYMANGENGQSASWNELYERAYNVAATILENASVTNDEMYREYKELRDHLRNHAISLDERYTHDLQGFESISDFRKAYMGRIKLNKNGTPVDQAYHDLAITYPEFFDEEQYANPADQLIHIADVLDNLRPIEENPYAGNMRESATWLANDVLERFFELPQAKPTFADKAQQKQTQVTIRERKKLEQLRAKKNERIAEIIKQERERTSNALRKERDKRDATVRKIKDRYKEREAKASEKKKASILRARIMRHSSALSQKLLRPTDKQHIPQELQGVVAKLLESINLESNYTFDTQSGTYRKTDDGLPTKRTKAFAELQKQYTTLAGELTIDPDLLGDDGLLTAAIALADKRIADMNSEELDIIWQTLRAVESSVYSANRAFSQAKWATISEAAEALRSDNAGKKDKVEYRGIFGKGQKLTGLDMMTPETYFHQLGSSGDALFRTMRNAQDEHIRLMKSVSSFTHEALKDVNVNKLEKEIHTVTLGGEEVKLTTAQLMELYVLTRREQARGHIFLGGILPDVVSAKGIKRITKAKPVRGVTAEEISEAINLLTKEQRAVAEKLQEFASTKLSEYGNQASMKVYGYEKFGEKYYWPIRVNRQETKSDIEKDTAVVTLANRGFTKGTRPNAKNSVRLGSIFDTFSTHSSEMATYAAWLGALEDVNRIRNYSFRNNQNETVDTVKAIIDTVHGTKGSAYLQKLLADVTNGVKGTHGETNYMSGLVGNYKAASVGANLRVIIQQPTAILRAMDMIGPQYLVAGVKPNKGWQKAMKYAPIAQWKDWGYFDINTGRQMKDVLFDSDSALDKIKNVSMWGAGKMDSLSWGMLWNAVETETKAKHKDLQPGTNEFYEEVAKRFTEIVDHTQVVDGILQRSQIMRSADGLTKMATSFMGEPTKQYNMMMAAAYDAKNSTGEQRKAAKQRLARTAVTLVISGVVNAMAQSVMDAVRDDDKEKEWQEKWLNAMFGFTGEEEGAKENWDAFWSGNLGNTVNPASYIPYVKDIVSILQGYDVSRMDMESVEKTITASQNMIKAINGDGKFTLAGASANLFAEAARLIGMPIANLKREVKSFAMLAAVETDNYVMQYQMEKAALRMNYSSNKGVFLDILYNAYKNDKEAYRIIYNDLIELDLLKTDKTKTKDYIEAGIEDRKKKETAYVEKQETVHSGLLSSVHQSPVYTGLTTEEKEYADDKAKEYADVKAMLAMDKSYEPPKTYAWIKKAEEVKQTCGVPVETYIVLSAKTKDIKALVYANKVDKNGDPSTIQNSASLQIMEAIYQTGTVSSLSDNKRKALFEALGVGESVAHFNQTLVANKLKQMRRQAK